MTKKRTNKKGIATAVLLSASLFFTGCSATATDESSTATESVQTAVQSESGQDYTFSDADLDSSYDESSAVKITLNGTAATVSGDGAKAENGTVIISQEGTYILSGTLNDGQIVVEAPETAKIKLVLKNVSVTNNDGPALYIKQADKVFVTLPEGTTNSLADGTSYTGTDANNPDAAVFSQADLCFNGAGSLNVNGNYKHGIVSKDDLIFTGGTFTVKAVSQGLNGKDCIKVANGTFTVEAGSDALQSDNTEDTGKGYIYLKDGTFNLTAGNDGIQAETVLKAENGTYNITTEGGAGNASTTESGAANGNWQFGAPGENNSTRQSVQTATTETTDSEVTTSDSAKGIKAGTTVDVSGGTFNLNTADDAVHTNGNAAITGGSFTIASGDDGIHADTDTTITNGSITITKSYEGIEGTSVIISGATIDLTASDDGLNAAGGNDASSNSGRAGENNFTGETGAITISGGTLKINASGDGIDANGSLTISGGDTFVSGPTNSGNGSLDYDGTATITGGNFIAAGSAGMAQGFSSDSAQASILYNLSSAVSGGTSFTLTDSAGTTILTGTPDKSYQSLVLSSDKLSAGGTYTLTVGSQSTQITLMGNTYSNGGGAQGGGQPGGGQRPGN